MYATVCGYVGQDSKIVETSGGQKMLKFSIADEVYVKGNKETQWVNCADFRKSSVEKLHQYIKKGSVIAVSGEISLNRYETSDGTTKTDLQCIVHSLKLLGSAKKDEKSSPAKETFGDDETPF